MKQFIIAIAVILSLSACNDKTIYDSNDGAPPAPPPPPVPTEINFISFTAHPNTFDEIDITSVIENIGDAKSAVRLRWIVRDGAAIILDDFSWLLPSVVQPGDIVNISAASTANYLRAEFIEYWVSWDDGNCFDCGESLHYEITTQVP